MVAEFGGYVQAQARFATAAGSGQGQQTHVFAQQELLHGGDFPLAPNERRGLNGQVVRVGVECLEGRKIGGQAGDDELKEMALLL